MNVLKKLFLLIAVFWGINGCNNAANMGNQPAAGRNSLRTSGSIQVTLLNSKRGYFTNYLSLAAENPPRKQEIYLAKNALRKLYHCTALYIFFHREVEPAVAKELFLEWKNAKVTGRWTSPVIIPTLLLQDYSKEKNLNFSNDELRDLIQFLVNNINSTDLAIYEVVPKPDRNYGGQLTSVIKANFPNLRLHKFGIQPAENMTQMGVTYAYGIQDNYGGIANGITNATWETQCGWGGKYGASAKKTLEIFIADRVGVKCSHVLVAVAEDYTTNYPCGEDTGNDWPLPAGRNYLAEAAILSQYPGGTSNPNWVGFSFDGKILEAYCNAKDPKEDTFYQRLKKGQIYSGYYSAPLNEIRAIFDKYD